MRSCRFVPGAATRKNWRDPVLRLQDDENGLALVLLALSLPLLLGFAALALDFGYALARTRQMQVVADVAAYNGATAIVAGFDPQTHSRYRDEVYSATATSGFANGATGITVTPSYNSNAVTINGFSCSPRTCVTVQINEQRVFPLLRFFQSFNSLANPQGSLSYQVAATAMVVTVNDYCMLATANSNNNMVGAFSLQGSVTINSPNCGIADNSRNPSAFTTTGSAFTLNAPVSVVGGWTYNGNPSQFSITYGTPVPDPYKANASLYSSLNAFPGGSGVGLSGCPTAGVHYGSVSINNGGNCTLSAGTYYFDSITNFKNTTWTGSGVTIVIGPSGRLDTGANGALNISAPTSGAYAGVAITSLSSSGASFQGNPGFGTSFGALYWPNGPVDLQGTPSGVCLQIIADSISLSGNSSITNTNQDCIASQYKIQRKIVQLIN